MKCKNIYCERQDDMQTTGCRLKDVIPKLCILNKRYLSTIAQQSLSGSPKCLNKNCDNGRRLGTNMYQGKPKNNNFKDYL